MPKELELMGKMVEVEIIETGKHFMKSRLVEEADIKEPGLVKPLNHGEVSGVSKELTQENKVSLVQNHNAKKTVFFIKFCEIFNVGDVRLFFKVNLKSIY